MSKQFVRSLRLLTLAGVFALTFNSCKKDDSGEPSGKTTAIVTAHYNWGDLSINPKNYDDVIAYNAAGQIETVTTSGQFGSTVNFTYSGNEIILNTPYNDTYELDNQGRVVLHTAIETQHDMTFMRTAQYNYDVNGFLSRISLSINGTEYSKILYEVNNGNYTKYTLQNTNDGKITREYAFTYGSARINSTFAAFTPVLSNNTFSTVEKYLNFGKQSANMLSAINYKIVNLDNTVKTGTLSVQISTNADKNITGFKLAGDAITGLPADNLSPLPRSVSFELAQ